MKPDTGYDLFTQPSEPKAGTQAAAVLRGLKRGLRISPLDALEHYGCMRLAAVVFDLKALGWHITTTMVEVRGRNGTKRFARYSMHGHDKG